MKSIKHYGGGLQKGATVVMGIDQSYSGFAVTFLSAQGTPNYETFVYKAPGSGIDRVINIQGWLASLFINYNIIDSALEAPVKMSHSALLSGELFGAVRLTIKRELGQYPLQVPPTIVKKYVTGKGTGVQKNQMLLQVYKKWDVEFDDDNAADSYGIARIVSGRNETAYEKEIINKLKDLKFRDQPFV
jgi:hypothetical protein